MADILPIVITNKTTPTGACVEFSDRNLSGVVATVYQPAATSTFGSLWSARVVTNGGAAPAAGTVTAVNTFWAGVQSCSLDTKMKAVNIFAPDNLIACQTPIYVGSGLDPWTNLGSIAEGDLTVNGLIGAASKGLSTGVVPSTAYAGDDDGGFTFYVHTYTDNIQGVWVTGGGNGNMSAYPSTGGTCYWDCWLVPGGRISGANATQTGYFSFNRTSAAASAVYKANSGVGHTTIASNTGESSIGNRPSVAIYAMCANNGGAVYGGTATRMSFFAVHSGLTSAESANFYNLIQALRTSLGGGYV